MEVKGALDSYLTAEEEAYFKSGGSEQTETKLEEMAESEDGEGIGTDDSQHHEKEESEDNEPGEPVDEVSDGQDGEPDEPRDDGLKHDKSDRDYEKAFKAERHKRKELKEALEANTRKTSEMEQTLAQLKQSMLSQQQAPQQQVPAQQQESVPDPEEDPLGYQQYQIKQLEKTIVSHNKYLTQKHEHEQRSAQESAFNQAYANAAREFTTKTKDFMDAYKYITEARIEEHVAAGFSREKANLFLMDDEKMIVAQAFQDNVNPAERIYNLAKARGYTGATATNNKKLAPKNLEDIKRGLNNSKSLKSGGGELPDKEAGIEDVGDMNFQEFDEFWARLKSKSKHL